MTHIPDPIEQINANMERLEEFYTDEHTCMACGTKVDYDLYCMSPTGDGPGVCGPCTGMSVRQLEHDFMGPLLEENLDHQ